MDFTRSYFGINEPLTIFQNPYFNTSQVLKSTWHWKKVLNIIERIKNHTQYMFHFICRVSSSDQPNIYGRPLEICSTSPLTGKVYIRQCFALPSVYILTLRFFFKFVSRPQRLRLVYSKNFSRATFSVFWVTYLVNRYLSYLPVKQIWRKSPVWFCYRSDLKIIYSEKATKFCESSTLFLSYVVQVCGLLRIYDHLTCSKYQ